MDPVIEDYYERQYKRQYPNANRNYTLMVIFLIILFSIPIIYFFTGPRVQYYFPDIPQIESSS